jgi:hypothetical protein
MAVIRGKQWTIQPSPEKARLMATGARRQGPRNAKTESTGRPGKGEQHSAVRPQQVADPLAAI